MSALPRSPRASARYPVWTPDGTRISFIVHEAGAQNLWLFSPDGAERRKLTDFAPGTVVGIIPSFSPDGRWVVFSRIEQQTDMAQPALSPSRNLTAA